MMSAFLPQMTAAYVLFLDRWQRFLLVGSPAPNVPCRNCGAPSPEEYESPRTATRSIPARTGPSDAGVRFASMVTIPAAAAALRTCRGAGLPRDLTLVAQARSDGEGHRAGVARREVAQVQHRRGDVTAPISALVPEPPAWAASRPNERLTRASLAAVRPELLMVAWTDVPVLVPTTGEHRGRHVEPAAEHGAGGLSDGGC